MQVSTVRAEKIEYERMPRCQVNVGRGKKLRTCGEPLKKINSWTWKCRKHGEVH